MKSIVLGLGGIIRVLFRTDYTVNLIIQYVFVKSAATVDSVRLHKTKEISLKMISSKP